MRLCYVSCQKGYKNVNALTYGDGKIRTYVHDEIDSRLEGTKRLDQISEIIDHMATSEDGILIPVEVAKRLFGWKANEFDER